MKALALLLTAGMLFTGCGGSAGNTPEEEPETGGSGKTMGRYMEEAVGMPEDMMRNAGITRLTDGSLQIFDYNNGPCISQDEIRRLDGNGGKRLLYDCCNGEGRHVVFNVQQLRRIG